MNILEEFYYGSLNLQEKTFQPDSEYAGYIKIVAENEEKLAACMNTEERRLLSQLMDAQSEILAAETLDRFIEGWRLGARFMLDTLFVPLFHKGL